MDNEPHTKESFWGVEARFRTINPMLGHLKTNPRLEALVLKSTVSGIHAPKHADYRFRRTCHGQISIGADDVEQWIALPIKRNHPLVIATNIIILTNRAFSLRLPVIAPKSRQGIGTVTYELVPKDTELTIQFDIPRCGVFTPRGFIHWLAGYAPRPFRGLSGRGRRFGKMELIGSRMYKLPQWRTERAAIRTKAHLRIRPNTPPITLERKCTFADNRSGTRSV